MKGEIMQNNPPSGPNQQPSYAQYPQYQQPTLYPPPPNITVVQQRQQLSFLIRALYFCFIGWWFGIAWALTALLLICTIILAPIGLLMLNSLPTVLTLYQK